MQWRVPKQIHTRIDNDFKIFKISPWDYSLQKFIQDNLEHMVRNEVENGFILLSLINV